MFICDIFILFSSDLEPELTALMNQQGLNLFDLINPEVIPHNVSIKPILLLPDLQPSDKMVSKGVHDHCVFEVPVFVGHNHPTYSHNTKIH